MKKKSSISTNIISKIKQDFLIYLALRFDYRNKKKLEKKYILKYHFKKIIT